MPAITSNDDALFRVRIKEDIMHHPWGLLLYIYGKREQAGKVLRIKQPLEFEWVEADNAYLTETKPVIILDKNHGGDATCQMLLEDLWALGYRPQDIGTAGHLAATQQHLSDMRHLVAHALQAPLPGTQNNPQTK